MEPVGVYALWIAALTAMAASGGPLNAPTLILFSNAATITPATIMTDLTECTFTGYAAVTGITFGTPYLDVVGRARMDAPGGTFTLTGTSVTETVYGWALTNVGKTTLYCAQAFTTPIPLTIVGQGLTVDPTYAYGD